MKQTITFRVRFALQGRNKGELKIARKWARLMLPEVLNYPSHYESLVRVVSVKP